MVDVLAGAVLVDALDVVWLELVVDDPGAVELELELVLLVLLELLELLEDDELLVELDDVVDEVECVVELVLEVLDVVVPGHSYESLLVVVPSNVPTVLETCTRQALKSSPALSGSAESLPSSPVTVPSANAAGTPEIE